MDNSFRDFHRMLSGLNRLRPAFKIPARDYVLLFTLTIAAAALETVGIGLLLPMLELLRDNGNQSPTMAVRILMDWLPGRNMGFYTITLCVSVIGAIVLKNFLIYLGNRMTAHLRATALLNVRDAIFRRIQHSGLETFENSTSGEMASILLLDTGRTAYSIEFLMMFLQRFLIAVFYVIALFVISWQLSILAGIVAGLCGWALGYSYKVLARSGREIGTVGEKLSSYLAEALQGTRLIRATHSQQREIDRFFALNKEFAEVQRQGMVASASLNPITESLGVIGGMAIVAGAAVWLVQPGYLRGEMLLGFAFVLLRLLPAITMVYGLYGQTINLAGGVEQTEKWMGLAQYPKKKFGQKTFEGFSRALQVRNLSYEYNNGHRALDGVDFDIEAGKITALVGASGSGKTTLAALFLRMRAPTEGCILADGVDYWEFSPESWHRNVAIVEQEAFLFQGTLLDNVRYGVPDASVADVENAIRKAHLEHVVKEMPNQLLTVIGERGATLSGGQRQRLSIARALVRNPKLLILDEATSALDSLSEAQVQSALDEAQEGRTVVVIAHRFSTIRKAHKIIVLDQGRVVEQGSWAELEARGGAFYSLLNASQQVEVQATP